MGMARGNPVDDIRAELSEIAGLDQDSARTMPPAFYTSPEFLEIEQEHLLRRQWLCVGHTGEIPQPGDFFTAELLGEPLLVVRDQENKVRVLSNVCRHRGNLVAEGKGNTKRFMCQYHAWTYRTDGSLLRAPYMEDVKNFDLKGCALPRLACEIWNHFISSIWMPPRSHWRPGSKGCRPSSETTTTSYATFSTPAKMCGGRTGNA